MSLCFGGDFALPAGVTVDADELIGALHGESLVVNLEGAFVEANAVDTAEVANRCKYNLYSQPSAVHLLTAMNVVAASLANNHISDYVGASERTAIQLEQSGITAFGTDSRPYADITVGGARYRLCGVVSPLAEPGRDMAGFASRVFNPASLLAELREWNSADPGLRLVVVIHWGYELSLYPQPADREWARAAIAAGAHCVIGHHPHVVQGAERVGRGFIAYSLGNFVLPQTKYRDRLLHYPDPRVAIQLAVSIGESTDGDGPDVRLRWFAYERSSHRITCDGPEESLDESRRLRALTPFAGLGDAEYRAWYRKGIESGVVRGKRGEPVLWSYEGYGRWHSAMVLSFLAVKRWLRRQLIAAGLHTPYNWKESA